MEEPKPAEVLADHSSSMFGLVRDTRERSQQLKPGLAPPHTRQSCLYRHCGIWQRPAFQHLQTSCDLWQGVPPAGWGKEMKANSCLQRL